MQESEIYIEENDYKKQLIENGKKCVETGDETEKFIVDIIKEFNLFYYEHTGYTGNKYDLIYQINTNDAKRALQIKTLSKNNTYDGWQVNINKNYDLETLLVLVNKKRDRFGLIFIKDCSTTTVTLNFNKNNTKHQLNKFTDKDKFKEQLKILMNNSVIYDEKIGFTEKQQKEMDMLERLKSKCNKLSLIYCRNETAGNEVDCYINSYSIQCKFSSCTRSSEIYHVNIRKSKTYYNNKSNIDYFIIEINGNLGHFYIISMKDMIERGYITDENHKGYSAIQIALIHSQIEHWSHFYFDKFEQLR
jgi:hypothetical protein